MGDITEFFQSELKVSKKAAAAIKRAEGAIATISTIGTIIGAASAILDLYFDQSESTSSEVDELIAEFRAVTASSESVALMREVALQIEAARTQRDAVRSFLPGELNSESQRGLILNQSAQVVRNLGNDSFWLRPFFIEGAYRDPWVAFDRVPDLTELATGAKAVFDWRLSLPAYLEAIAIRLLVLSALVENYRVNHQAELLEIADRLERFHQRISNGIKLHRPPTTTELESHTTDEFGNPNLKPPRWSGPFRLYGAVEVYSARNSVIDYPEDSDISLLPDQLMPPDRYGNFLVRHTVKSLHRWKILYNEIGLPEVHNIIGSLRRLADRPHAVRDAGQWSVREVDQAIADALHVPESERKGHLSVRVLLSQIGRSNSVRGSFES